ncbi:unnamed protein product, partial [Vitis vinifera]
MQSTIKYTFVGESYVITTQKVLFDSL